MRPTRGPLSLAPLALTLPLVACGGGERSPNVVLICVDTLRADHMSLFGYGRETTPSIDSWAERGTVFEHASSTSSWTLPSVAMLMTGQMRVGKDYGEIRAGQPYLPEHLAAGGYETAAVIANPLYHVPTGSSTNLERGFDHYAAFGRGAEGLGDNSWPAEHASALAIEWLEQRGGGAFFLYVHYFDPHHPYDPDGGTRFEPHDDPERAAAFEAALAPGDRQHWTPEVYARIESEIALYDSELAQADRGVGQLLRYLDETGLSEGTLVVLTADHGEGLWQRRKPAGEGVLEDDWFPYLYFEHGIMLTSDQVHVPLVFVGPGVPAGVRREEHVSLIDVVPTVLARVNAPVETVLHGVDLLAGPVQRQEVFAVCSRGTTVTLGGRWRLHEPREYRIERFGAGPELYDLVADPGETRPLQNPGRIETLRSLIAAWRARHESGAAAASALDEASLAALRAMGYADQIAPEDG